MTLTKKKNKAIICDKYNKTMYSSKDLFVYSCEECNDQEFQSKKKCFGEGTY